MTRTQYQAKSMDAHGIIQYSNSENTIWQYLINRQMQHVNGRACDEYLDGLDKLSLSQTHIPQLADIDHVLYKTTGWKTAAVPALISFNQFFQLLANKQFPVATFIRCKQDIDYIKEPDIFHEVFGHCPLLTNQAFANFSEVYGKLGLAATKEQRAYLARLYWFTVEFGLLSTATKELRIYGGGILSSPTETLYSLSSTPKVKPFDLLQVLRTPYRIDILQPIYYLIENLDFLDEIRQMDILGNIKQAQTLGLLPPMFDSSI